MPRSGWLLRRKATLICSVSCRGTLLPNAPCYVGSWRKRHALGAATGNIGRSANEAGDRMVIAACRRIVAAGRIGWRKRGDPADLNLVYSASSRGVSDKTSETTHLVCFSAHHPRYCNNRAHSRLRSWRAWIAVR
jgi:hypothetical protein